MIDFGPLIPDVLSMAYSFVDKFAPIIYVFVAVMAAASLIYILRRGL